MNRWIVLILLSAFIVKGHAQIEVLRCHYNSEHKSFKARVHRILGAMDYPWGVCLNTNNISSTEAEWTREAMRRWNKEYEKYIKKHSCLFLSAPDTLLFTESCNNQLFHIIYPQKAILPSGALGGYRTKGDSTSFHGVVEMSSKTSWRKPHFINVMMHELGHALGIPHLDREETEIMTSHNFRCGNRGKDKICQLKEVDFEAFLISYDPEAVELKQDQEASGCSYRVFDFKKTDKRS